MASRASSLLVILFGLSQLFICLHAVPTTRIRRLDDASQNTHLANADEMSVGVEVDLVERSKMDIEVNDYPGSGANNRHTPKPPQHCGDC